jgi:hypothetical protein
LPKLIGSRSYVRKDLIHRHQSERAAAVRRARFGPGPRRQARWVGRGLRGQRRAGGAPLRLEGPTRIMRGVRPVTVTPHDFRRSWREADGPAVVLAGAAAEYGGDRSRPVTGGTVRGSRRAVGLASEGRGVAAAPRRRDPRVSLSRLRRVTLAALPLGCSRPFSLFTTRGRQAPARRRCALDSCIDIAHRFPGHPLGRRVRRR